MVAGDALTRAEPRLAGLHRLRTRWMNGIMFYLDRDVPLIRGHTIYIDSPWALTSISQAQFWPRFDLEPMGDGRVEGMLSMDVSDWEAKGILHGKQAMYCCTNRCARRSGPSSSEGLNDAGIDVLHDANVVAWFLDPSIVYPNPNQATNLEPLLINTAGSWRDRPEAVTAIDEPVPGVRLRAHPHRPGDHGGRQRGRAAGRERDPRRHRLEPPPLRGVAASRAGDVRARQGDRPGALGAPTPRQAARSDWAGRHRRLGAGVRGREAVQPAALTRRRASATRPA